MVGYLKFLKKGRRKSTRGNVSLASEGGSASEYMGHHIQGEIE